jgi:prepilin-type N-terminal cleavage/methylation domain-containing protein/prepilin-type processing-associated H-X9-DG protein
MRKLRAFTLIELLVVVAIIALLIAILLPALGRVRKRANTTVCLTNVRGLTQAVHIYVQAYNTMFQAGGNGGVGVWDYQLLGGNLTRQQFANGQGSKDRMRFCPETSMMKDLSGSTAAVAGAANSAWVCVSPFDASIKTVGSYGLNTWLYVAPANPQPFEIPPGTSVSDFYQVKTITRESLVPAFIDSTVHDFTASPNDTLTQSAGSTAMPHEGGLTCAVIDRHIKRVNVSFYDGHAETPRFAELSTFRWTRSWTRTSPLQ